MKVLLSIIIFAVAVSWVASNPVVKRVKRITHPDGQHPPPPDAKYYDRNNDPHPNHRNFVRTGPDHLFYTVRTGSKPDDQDGPIVAFFYKPSSYGDVPGKFYVRDIPFYF